MKVRRKWWLELKNMCAWDLDEKPAPHRPCVQITETFDGDVVLSGQQYDLAMTLLGLISSNNSVNYREDAQNAIDLLKKGRDSE
jgi:hypothetical protein